LSSGPLTLSRLGDRGKSVAADAERHGHTGVANSKGDRWPENWTSPLAISTNGRFMLWVVTGDLFFLQSYVIFDRVTQSVGIAIASTSQPGRGVAAVRQLGAPLSPALRWRQRMMVCSQAS
jgi:hypothetical protein